MYTIEVDELQKLLLDGQRASKYAWDHYEELVAREHTYTLYGPYCYNIGASIPSSLTPVRARNLTKATRRKDYHIYQLDKDYRVIRTISVQNHSKIECTYHHFELDGVIYAYPFRGTEKERFTGKVESLRFANGKPVFFGIASSVFVFAQFYDYVDNKKMIVSTYRYSPYAQFSVHGHPIDPNALVGAKNSCVDFHWTEECSEYIDFSHWFAKS